MSSNMKRIIWHWTAGGHKATGLDRNHYHYIIEADGTVVDGIHPPEANLAPQPGKYATHTLNCNTGSIGVAVAAMLGAQERPFKAGKAPITPSQVKALHELTAELCRRYKIPITKRTVLSHAEVQPTLGIKQKGKWDIAWLPGMEAPGNPVEVGDKLRWGAKMARKPAQPPQSAPVAPKSPPAAPGKRSGLVAAILAALARIFRRPQK